MATKRELLQQAKHEYDGLKSASKRGSWSCSALPSWKRSR